MKHLSGKQKPKKYLDRIIFRKEKIIFRTFRIKFRYWEREMRVIILEASNFQAAENTFSSPHGTRNIVSDHCVLKEKNGIEVPFTQLMQPFLSPSLSIFINKNELRIILELTL